MDWYPVGGLSEERMNQHFLRIESHFWVRVQNSSNEVLSLVTDTGTPTWKFKISCPDVQVVLLSVSVWEW